MNCCLHINISNNRFCILLCCLNTNRFAKARNNMQSVIFFKFVQTIQLLAVHIVQYQCICQHLTITVCLLAFATLFCLQNNNNNKWKDVRSATFKMSMHPHKMEWIYVRKVVWFESHRFHASGFWHILVSVCNKILYF